MAFLNASDYGQFLAKIDNQRKELGEFEMKSWINAIVAATRAAKADDESLKLQNEFYEKSKHPLDTRP